MRFLGTKSKGDVVLLGVPMDCTVSYRPGTRFAPLEIRKSSEAIESYSPYLDMDLEQESIWDAGDLELPFGNAESSLVRIEEAICNFLSLGRRILSIGGEHLLSLGVIRAFKRFYPDVLFIHIDAHTDSRDHYLGEKLSHACVIRRIREEGVDIVQLCARSGLKSEFEYLKKESLFFSPFSLSLDFIENVTERPLYVSIDIDVLDPAFCPGVGTPEPGGIEVKELIRFISNMRNYNIVGADLVELSPLVDPSGNSSVVAALIVRELLLLLSLSSRYHAGS